MVYQLPAQTYFYQKDIIVLNVGNGGMIYNNYQFHHPSNPQQPIQQPYVFNAPVSHWGIKKISHWNRLLGEVFFLRDSQDLNT